MKPRADFDKIFDKKGKLIAVLNYNLMIQVYSNGDFFSLWGSHCRQKKQTEYYGALDFATAAVILIFSFALGKVSLVPLMILYGISGIYQPAVQANIPLIAEKQFLMRGNAVINMVSTLASLLGPIIGGVLFNLILSAMMLVGIPVIVVQILGMSDTAIGITHGAMGLGGLMGGIIAGAAANSA